MATDGAQKGEFRNRFHIRCDVTEPAVSQLPANNDYILDKRMFAGGFEPAEKTMLYNLWWAACRAESEKYKSIAPAPALIQSNQAPAPSPPLKSAQQTQLAQNAVPKAPNQSPSNDKLEKSILLIYQQYLVAKVCEANGGGRINLNQTRERLKLFDKSIRGKGYDPDAMFKKAKEVPLDQAQQIVLTTASMLPLVQGSERAQILLACNQFIQNAEHVVNLTVDALEPKSQSNDKLGDKDF